MGMFMNLGLALVIYGVLSKLFKRNVVEKVQETINDESLTNNKNDNKSVVVCSYCGNVLKVGENKCESCGAGVKFKDV
jgi:Fe2+ or Zn2+ uptake regulation protein